MSLDATSCSTSFFEDDDKWELNPYIYERDHPQDETRQGFNRRGPGTHSSNSAKGGGIQGGWSGAEQSVVELASPQQRAFPTLRLCCRSCARMSVGLSLQSQLSVSDFSTFSNF